MAYHAALHSGGRPSCAHSWRPSWDQLIQYLGANADLVADRSTLERFRCERCGARGATVIAHSPDEIEHRSYGGHANVGLSLTYGEALAAEMERRRQMRLYGLKTKCRGSSGEQTEAEARAAGSEGGHELDWPARSLRQAEPPKGR